MPGIFFDVNPGKRRTARHSRFESHVRFSFGPPRDVMEAGLDRLEEMVREGGRRSAPSSAAVEARRG